MSGPRAPQPIRHEPHSTPLKFEEPPFLRSPACSHPTRLEAQILAYFDTHGVSNGGTEAINLIIEKVRRLAHGFKDFDHYRLRIMLAADGWRPYRTAPNHA